MAETKTVLTFERIMNDGHADFYLIPSFAVSDDIEKLAYWGQQRFIKSLQRDLENAIVNNFYLASQKELDHFLLYSLEGISKLFKKNQNIQLYCATYITPKRIYPNGYTVEERVETDSAYIICPVQIL